MGTKLFVIIFGVREKFQVVIGETLCPITLNLFRKDMGTKFNFKSQICTTREQSERLLALGLKKETADMCWTIDERDNIVIGLIDKAVEYILPAWSLHRLIEMMPYCIEMNNKYWCLQISKGYVRYAHNGIEKPYIGYIQKLNTFDAIIECIE